MFMIIAKKIFIDCLQNKLSFVRIPTQPLVNQYENVNLNKWLT